MLNFRRRPSKWDWLHLLLHYRDTVPLSFMLPPGVYGPIRATAAPPYYYIMRGAHCNPGPP